MENRNITDMTEELQAMIDRAGEGETVLLPRGTVKISHELHVKNKRGVRIMGQDTLLLHTGFDMLHKDNHANTGVFVIEACTDLTIGNFTVDYAGRLNISGRVAEVFTGEKPYFILTLYPEFYSLCGEEDYRTALSFDEDGAPNYHLAGDGGGMSVEKIGEDRLKVYYANATQVGRLSIGEQVNIRLSLRGPAVFTHLRSSGTVFCDITIHQAISCSFLIAGRSRNVTFERLSITFREGTKQLMTSNADAIHIKSMTGKLTLRDCVFDGLGDDAVNVHSRAGILTGLAREDGTVFLADGWSKKPADPDWAEAGDRVEIYDPKTFLPRGQANVLAYEAGKLTLDALPNDLCAGDVLANLAFLPAVHITGCTVTRNRERAFLMQTRNVLIENCRMNRISLPAIIVAPDIQRWFEVGPAQNVVIRNNTIRKCAFVHDNANMGAITVKASHDHGYADYPIGVHRDITIEGNRIEEAANAGIFVSATDGVTLRDNDIRRHGEAKSDLPGSNCAIYLVNCGNITEEGNRTEPGKNLLGKEECR